jgi:hypothetical protein
MRFVRPALVCAFNKQKTSVFCDHRALDIQHTVAKRGGENLHASTCHNGCHSRCTFATLGPLTPLPCTHTTPQLVGPDQACLPNMIQTSVWYKTVMLQNPPMALYVTTWSLSKNCQITAHACDHAINTSIPLLKNNSPCAWTSKRGVAGGAAPLLM